MTSRYSDNRTLVPIKPEPPFEGADRIPVKRKFGPDEIKSEFAEDNMIRLSHSDEKLSMTSRYSLVRVHGAVKQENITENATAGIKRENGDYSYNNESNHVDIKREYGGYSYNNESNHVDIKREYGGYSYNNESNYVGIKPEVSGIVIEDSNDSEAFTAQCPTKRCKIDHRDINTIYKCSCNQKFNDKFQHFHHMIGHMAEKLDRVKCNYCNRYYKSGHGIMAHVREWHTGYKCMFCAQVFAKQRQRLVHMKLYHHYLTRKQQLKQQKRLNQQQIDHLEGLKQQQKWSHREYINNQRQMWQDMYRQDEEKTKYTINRKKMAQAYSEFKMEPDYSNVKIEPTSNVKKEPIYSNVNFQGTYSNVKVEPSYTRVEPTFPNVKTEPIY